MISGFRVIKRILLVFIAVGLVLVAILFGKRFLGQPVVSPTPDPFADLAPLEVSSVDLLKVQQTDFDVLVKVKNPNSKYGSGDVQYTLKLSSADKSAEFPGSFYILPGQTKYVVITPITTDFEVTKAELVINSVGWQELDSLALSGVNFVVTNSSYSQVPQAGIFARVRGFVANNSDFDVSRVDASIILFDDQNRPLAVNKTEIHTFLAHTTRGFEVSWFSPFVGDVTRTYVEVNSNLFEQDSFIRKYGGLERFQTF